MTRLSDFCMYGGKLEHVTEATSIMLCSGLSEEQILKVLGIKLGIIDRTGRVIASGAFSRALK